MPRVQLNFHQGFEVDVPTSAHARVLSDVINGRLQAVVDRIVEDYRKRNALVIGASHEMTTKEWEIENALRGQSRANTEFRE